MVENEQRGSAGPGITGPLVETATMIVTPLRSAALIALGGTALVAEAARRRLSYAADESERQLELFSRSVRRTMRFWRRKGPHSAASSGRSSRTTAAG